MNKLNLNTFDDFYAIVPAQIKDYIDKCKGVSQTPYWHSEGDVYIHERIVFNRAKRTGDLNLMLAAIFHDLGKVDVTIKHPYIPNKWTTKFHEKVSARLVKENKQWIKDLGGDYDLILFIVDQHMRAKQINQMRLFKREQLKSHPYYSYLEQFTKFDDMSINYDNDINN